MRAIALSFLLAFAAATLPAATHDEVVDLFASLASALSDDNPAGFMKAIDPAMPDYDQLKREVTALLVDSEISNSVEPLSDTGTALKRSVDLDWYMELHSREDQTTTRRRRQVIHCELVLQGKHWRIVSLKPLEFFAEKPE